MTPHPLQLPTTHILHDNTTHLNWCSHYLDTNVAQLLRPRHGGKGEVNIIGTWVFTRSWRGLFRSYMSSKKSTSMVSSSSKGIVSSSSKALKMVSCVQLYNPIICLIDTSSSGNGFWEDYQQWPWFSWKLQLWQMLSKVKNIFT